MSQQSTTPAASTDTVNSRFTFVFITDPLSELAPAHDTTVALMEAAQAQGHRVLVTTIAELGVTAGRATAKTRDVTLQPAVLIDGNWVVGKNWFVATESGQIFLDTAAAVFMRTDPPVDADYLRATYILDLVDPERTLMVNSPSGLRDANEKLFALRFPELGPPTLISADHTEIVETVLEWGKAVLKPTDGMAGRGIMLLSPGDPNLHSILDTATARGTEHVVIQKFVPEVDAGDRRVIVLGGAPIGAIRRIAVGDEFRCNMAAGARVEIDTLTDGDRRICKTLGPELVKRGLHFVGIDIIGDWLTEVNVTSPTGIREIDALSGTRLATSTISWVTAMCANARGR